MEIGERLKRLRIERGLTQEELADRAELSKGFISQMERDLTSPSIATLEDILICLGTDLNDFFSTREKPQVVFTDEDYFVKEDEARRHRIEWIVPNAQKNRMEPIRLTLQPGGSTMPDNPHEGEELGYVIRGSVRIHIGKDLHLVREGETFYLYPDEEHYLSSEEGAEILWVSSPPSF
ncbi:MAG: helix-turn-helix domain-containing protein [Mogibacterium sp.]|nr:helix-turn-helix domain-containing protein [Mogibacterium sp.]